MKLLQSEILIDAPAERIWDVLVDFDSYREWNPVEIEAKGTAGSSELCFEHTGKLPGRKPMTFRATIIKAEPSRALARWRGRILIPELFDVRHHFEIEPLDAARSRLRQFEYFSGVMVPFMRGVLLDTQAAFELANVAIKQRVESLDQ